jgi:tRNA1Val (adenine37-N6)-methyltransferase
MSDDARRARVRGRWTPPDGPLPAGDGGDSSLMPKDGESLDMLSGEWRIFQRRDGHRYSTDDLLCAWFGSACAAARGVRVRRALDLGAGIGSIAMMIAWAHREARVVGVEAQGVSADLFARSIRYNAAEERIELRRGDLRDDAIVPETRAFELVTGSPPYFDEGDGIVSEKPQRGPCRFEQRGGVEGYALTGARALADDGVMALVHTWAARDRVRASASSAQLAVVSSRPVVLREGRAPHLALYELAHLGSRAAETSPREPLVIRDARGARTPEYAAARTSIGFPP